MSDTLDATTERSTPHAASLKGTSAAGGIDLAYARDVLRAEARAVESLMDRVGADFERAATAILALNAKDGGRVVVAGMGKAGVMGQKIAATFASTGTPALFMHPAEAVHGDLGMVTPQDLVLAVSNSGETDELLRLLPTLRHIQCRLIAITASRESTLGRAADVVLEIGRIEEPCPLRMAPSASTTALLAMGDALALVVLKARGFTQEAYAKLHPAGSLGRKLLRVTDAMRAGDRMVRIERGVSVLETLRSMSRPPRNGAAVIVEANGKLAGVFTHGDFSRLMLRAPEAVNDPVEKHMVSPCRFIHGDAYVMEAQAMMHQHHINALPVVNAESVVLGLVDIQDLV
jgi:arabinose-5-phosphate isomerase